MVWVGTSCRWGRGRVACWRREVAGALCAARWPLARRKIARHRMLNLGETRRKHVSGIFWVSKRRRYCNEHPLGGSAARCPQPTCRTRRLLSCRCGFLERPTCGFQLQSRHSDIGSIFSNMYGVRPREHVCWHSLGRTTGSCVQIMHADMRANMYGPMRSLPFMCSCCTETGLFRAISDRSRGAGVESPLAYLRRRRVLCTLPILQPCALRHALHY